MDSRNIFMKQQFGIFLVNKEEDLLSFLQRRTRINRQWFVVRTEKERERGDRKEQQDTTQTSAPTLCVRKLWLMANRNCFFELVLSYVEILRTLFASWRPTNPMENAYFICIKWTIKPGGFRFLSIVHPPRLKWGLIWAEFIGNQVWW